MAFGDTLIGLSERLLAERKEEARRAEARRLIQALRSAGHTIELTEGDGIRVSPRPDDAMAARLREYKQPLLDVLRVQATKA